MQKLDLLGRPIADCHMGHASETKRPSESSYRSHIEAGRRVKGPLWGARSASGLPHFRKTTRGSLPHVAKGVKSGRRWRLCCDQAEAGATFARSVIEFAGALGQIKSCRHHT
jgi:hypothetical protein